MQAKLETITLEHLQRLSKSHSRMKLKARDALRKAEALHHNDDLGPILIDRQARTIQVFCFGEGPTAPSLRRVLTAEPYQYGALGSFGNARYMLMRQHKFPDTYNPEAGDRVASADHDRLKSFEYDHFQSCLKRHVGTGEMNIGSWATSAAPKRILDFLTDAMKADASVEWTGFRILGTVNRSNGYPVFTLEIFSKGEASETKIYSGQRAPNVSTPAYMEGSPFSDKYMTANGTWMKYDPHGHW